jgi:hypothetical protein
MQLRIEDVFSYIQWRMIVNGNKIIKIKSRNKYTSTEKVKSFLLLQLLSSQK